MIKFFFLKKTVSCFFRQGITMGKCKRKAIQAHFALFTHNLVYSGIIMYILKLFKYIQAYSEPCIITLAYLKLLYIQNPGIFRTRTISRTLVYSGLWYIQNAGIFRIFTEPKAFNETCQTSAIECFARIVNDYTYFHKL